MPTPRTPPPATDTPDALTRIEAKLDRLLANDADEQVAGFFGLLRRAVEPPWVQRGIQVVTVLLGIILLAKLGLINGQQQAAFTKVATAGLLDGSPLQQVLNAPPVVPESPAPIADPEADTVPADIDVQ